VRTSVQRLKEPESPFPGRSASEMEIQPLNSRIGQLNSVAMALATKYCRAALQPNRRDTPAGE